MQQSTAEPNRTDQVAHDLEARVERLEAEQAILSTLARYGHALDYGLRTEFADCWTHDAVFTSAELSPASDQAVLSWHGREAIVALFSGHTHAPNVFHKHFAMNPCIEHGQSHARVDCGFVRVDTGPDGPYIRTFGRYRDVLVPCADGKWRFAERYVEIEGRHPASLNSILR